MNKEFSYSQIYRVKKDVHSVFVRTVDPRGTDVPNPDNETIKLEPLTKIITLNDDPGVIEGPNTGFVEIRHCFSGVKYYMHRAMIIMNCEFVAD